ncbi:DUF932 domain-containing protein [Kitasatospora sp. NPDC088783]|uniref:DUF932 domain-containing protein n=1 Tax=Kitasatospora sp. NPDC088783 TaxID=3364077 RepID=UPI00380CE263
MAHMITATDNLFSVRETPWHGLGTVVGDYPGTWDEARVLAGLDWDPVEMPVYEQTMGFDEQGAPTSAFQLIDGFKRIVRSDNGHTLHIARDSYTVIDHAAMGHIVEAVLEIPGVQWETAGSLDGGRRVWALARIGEGRAIAGDFSPTLPYVAVLNSHDGSSACKVIGTGVRVVCQNTFSAAEAAAEKSGTSYSLKHTKGWVEQVEAAREAIDTARRSFDALMQSMDELAHVYVTPAQTVEFIEHFIAAPPEVLTTDRVKRNIAAARQRVHELLHSETTAPIAHTALGLVQAAGEYADWVRPARSAETMFSRSVLSDSDLKKRAVNIARQLTRV